MNQSLDVQNALSSRQIFGIQILPPPVGTGMPPERAILRLIMIRLHFTGGTNCGKRMLYLDPLHPRVALRTLDFHRHF
jgi:hypothetical protein